ncbi:hypothetical protein [uncultured Bacteroides sp.]|uniref:hypothetical protein n=1 Tax=uncultured Bacteroides sp. TaxID=162156 RepID=UPI002AA6773C|nr:hypothetical protein [uncultured Bacteroides sp.]
MSTSIQMFFLFIILSFMATLGFIVFLFSGDIDIFFSALTTASGAAFVLAFRARVWDEKKIIELEQNRYWVMSILILAILECIFLYLIYLSQNAYIMSISNFLIKWIRPFVFIIPIWILTLYNLRK